MEPTQLQHQLDDIYDALEDSIKTQYTKQELLSLASRNPSIKSFIENIYEIKYRLERKSRSKLMPRIY